MSTEANPEESMCSFGTRIDEMKFTWLLHLANTVHIVALSIDPALPLISDAFSTTFFHRCV